MLEKLLTKEDFINRDIALQTRLWFMNEVDWSEMDYTCDEVIEAMLQETLHVEDFIMFIDILVQIGRKEVTTSAAFLSKLWIAIKKESTDHAYNFFFLNSLREDIKRIGERISPDVFNTDEILENIDNLIHTYTTLGVGDDDVEFSPVEWTWESEEASDEELGDIMQEIKR